MKIIDIAINRPIASSLIFILIIVVGVIGFLNLNIDLFPEIVFPSGAVMVEYEGAGPEEIENLVVRPLEEILSSLENIQHIESFSRPGQATVVVNFTWGTDMDFAIMDMRELVDQVEGFFPDGAEDPLIVSFDPSMLPVVEASISGDDLEEIRYLAEDEIEPRLERLEGVASVDVSGGQRREIQITADPEKLAHYDLSITQITEFIGAENINLPGGDITVGDRQYTLRSMGQYDDWRDLENMIITNPQEHQIRLTEVADIEDAYRTRTHIARMNQQESVGLGIQREGDANTVAVSRRVREELALIEQEMEGITIDIGLDQAEFIEDSINNLIINAIFGGILAVIVLLIFLGNVSTTVIIGIAIPFSLITTFALLYFQDLTLNMMTMGGLALGVGMLVDNSIVVLENIYRLRQEGEGPIAAAGKGSKQVAVAILTSTITTAIVFLPVVFIEGLAQQLFSELALTVAFSLAASLFMALTLLPMLSRFLLRDNDKAGWMEKFQKKVFDPVFNRVQSLFSAILNFCLDQPWVVALVVLVILGAGALQFMLLGTEFLPAFDEGEVNINLELAPGTTLLETESVVKRIENELQKEPEVESIFSSIGTDDGALIGGGGGGGSNTARIMLRLVPSSERERTTRDLMEVARQIVGRIPGADYTVMGSEMLGAGLFGDPLAVRIHGHDLDQLEEYTALVEEIIRNIEGTQDVDSPLGQGRPELQINYDRSRLHQQGLTASEVGRIIENTIDGIVASEWRHEGREYDIRVQATQKESALRTLEDMRIMNARGDLIPLIEIADLDYTTGPRQINRFAQERIMEITSDVVDRDLGSIEQELRAELEAVDFAPGYGYTIAGEIEEMEDAFYQLFLALAMAIFLVYIVLGAQFESLVYPFIVMLAVPLALSGSLLGLAVAGHTINVVALIGIIMLVGIVVNNVIVLIDYIDQLRKEGYELRAAILEGASVRLRPIIMTALTTMLAMLPLALGIGEGAEMQAPIAMVVIAGLLIATFLTLNVIPVFYYVINRRRENSN